MLFEAFFSFFSSEWKNKQSTLYTITLSFPKVKENLYSKTFLAFPLFLTTKWFCLFCFSWNPLPGYLLGFCNTIGLFMFLRVLIGFCSMAVVVVSFVLCVELVSGKWRTIIGILNIFPVAIAYILCAGISYLTYNWRTMQFVIATPTLLLLCLWCFMPESPRWVLQRACIYFWFQHFCKSN